MIIKILLPLMLGVLCATSAAQASVVRADSVKTSANPTKTRITKRSFPDTAHSPLVAVKRSAIIPGYGQLYNRQWWKLPIIYAGLGALLGTAINNYHYYKQHLIVYQYYRSLTPVSKEMPEYQLYTNYKKTGIKLNQLEIAVNGAQRDTQFHYICFAGAWGLQIIDAYIDAKFIHSYSMSPDLSIKLRPKLHMQPAGVNTFSAATFTPMLCMSVNF